MDQHLPNILWRTKYASAYSENGKMVIRYRFPYSRQREAALLGTYCLTPGDRLPYYQTLSAMVERTLMLTQYLEEEAVPSILTFEGTYQKQEDNGIICIYGIPKQSVKPITHTLFADDCNALTALDVFLRLAHILRDINKTPISPVLRYLDMDDVYLTAENKILLGGFFYAAAEGLSSPPQFLPDAAPVVPDHIREGGLGSAGSDMQILAQIAWNIFAGLPWNCEHTAISKQIPPQFAPPSLRAVLELGLEGDPAQCNNFRKQLMQCRKALAKTDFAQLTIPMHKPLCKEYLFTSQSAANAADVAEEQRS